jgi:diguanylate cyclase (GGDEF)-like protein/PAS domain S-box-containing protein
MPLRRPQFSSRVAIAMVVLFAIVATIISIGQTWQASNQDRQLSIEAETRNGQVAVRLLEQITTQELANAQQRLNAISSEALALSAQDQQAGDAVKNIISNNLKNNRAAGAYIFTNTKGERWVSTFDFPSYVFPEEQRRYINDLMQNPKNQKIYLGQPLQRSIDSELVLPMAKNLLGRDGKHLGVVSTDISLGSVSTSFSNVAKNSRAIVELFTTQGDVVVHAQFNAESGQPDQARRSAFFVLAHNALEENVLLEHQLPGKAEPQMIVYRKNQRFPVVIVFNRDMNSVLAAWRSRTEERILFSGLFIAFQLLLSYFLLQQIHGFHQSQTQLQKSKESLRESETKFVNLFQRSPTPIALINLQNECMMEVNDALLNQFGFSRDEFIGRTPGELKLWVNPADRANYLQQLAQDNVVDRFEALLQHKDGTHIVCMVSSRMFSECEQRLNIFSITDVTHLREVEQEIRDLNRDLEQRVAQRTAKLELALESVKNMQADLERMAMTDELTSVPNRRFFLQQLEQEIERSRRYHRPMCLAMLDLDHFKQVNDRFGHAGGDEVLKHFSRFIRSRLRTGDLLGRLGGEEFAILLPETGVNSALFVLQRIRESLAQQALDHIAPDFHYTFSGGIASLPDDANLTATTLLANADHALYQAKENGRNQIFIFE